MKLESKKAQIYDRSYTEYTGNTTSNFSFCTFAGTDRTYNVEDSL